MAVSATAGLLSRLTNARNFVRSIGNHANITPSLDRNLFLVTRKYSVDINAIVDTEEDAAKPKKKLSKAMRAYLERAKEYDKFIKKEITEYEIGKRHLANMMGENPETFTQDDVNPELYLCTPVKLDEFNSYYITGFQPNATSDTAHHMLLFGCKEPGMANAVWNCGEMAHTIGSENNVASPCADGSEILYAWARDAPDLILPDGVGFKVGSGTQIKYLVLQVHYAHVERFQDGSTDDSGIILHYTLRPLNKLASVIVLGTAGKIPPHSIEHMESACTLKENKTLHPFAYRTHTHALGKVVSGYLVKPNGQWIELGKRDPLTPQMFYPVHHGVTATLGDTLAARCTMESNRDTWTHIGATNLDEMCNFYLMVYVENDEPPQIKYCFTSGPPQYYWRLDGLPNIPTKEASVL